MPAELPPLLDVALWLAGIACFGVLAAGVQVPRRLRWREELPLLTPFNRKLMWVYYGFIGLTIVGFGAFTLLFHDEVARGEPVALAVAGFIGAWWAARIAIDALVFDHADWPQGRGFVVGHAVLTATFVAMAATYLGVVAWHLWPAG